MNNEKRVSDFLDDLQRQGRYVFDGSRVEEALPVSSAPESFA
jgi:hypothetical protein